MRARASSETRRLRASKTSRIASARPLGLSFGLALGAPLGLVLLGEFALKLVGAAGHQVLHAKAPLRGFVDATAISDIVNRGLKRAGLEPPRKGAHTLRHALACTMLRRGASLIEIGQILRHRNGRLDAIDERRRAQDSERELGVAIDVRREAKQLEKLSLSPESILRDATERP